MAEWQYRIHRIEMQPDADLDKQLETVLQDYGAKGWELADILQGYREGHQVPEDPVYRLIFKTTKPLD